MWNDIPKYELANLREKIEERIKKRVRIVTSEQSVVNAARYAYEDVLQMIAEIEEKASSGCYNDE